MNKPSHAVRTIIEWSLVLFCALLWTAPAMAEGWKRVGVGDCAGTEAGRSSGDTPSAAKCDAQFAGRTAICWSGSCVYKNIPTTSCKGGDNPGKMYTCEAAAAPTTTAKSGTGEWQAAGTGDCTGHDTNSSTGATPNDKRCDASYEGFTAVCRNGICTYKNVPTKSCTGGAKPGQMYTCVMTSTASTSVQKTPEAGSNKISGSVYSVSNYSGEVQSAQEFAVNWKTCKVAVVGKDGAADKSEVTVQTCTTGKRLVVRVTPAGSKSSVKYDWVVLDDGDTLAGAYRDGSISGPSVGKKR
jgi:hypothetical protein